MDASMRSAGRQFSQVPELSAIWGLLSERARSILSLHGLDVPLVFQNCVDGSVDAIAQLVSEMGGAGDDATNMLELWLRAGRVADRATTIVANAPIISCTAHATKHAKRGRSIRGWLLIFPLPDHVLCNTPRWRPFLYSSAASYWKAILTPAKWPKTRSEQCGFRSFANSFVQVRCRERRNIRA